MTATHGGARPKTRDDDARGKHHSPKPGSGRKPKSFTLKLGDVFFKSQRDANGNGIIPSEIWTVTEITRSHVVMSSSNGDTYKLLR